jgi:hypothetical protein
MVHAAGFGTDEIAGVKLLIVNHQLAVEQVQLFDTSMNMWRIIGSWLKPHEHRDETRLRIDREHFAEYAIRYFLPLGLTG